jgi:hypothetical protein
VIRVLRKIFRPKKKEEVKGVDRKLPFEELDGLQLS